MYFLALMMMLTSILGSEIVLAKRKVQREKERLLKLERQKLTHKLSIRPRDQKSALKLIDVAYELQDYFSVCTLIHKLYLAHPPLTSNIELNLKLGRCALRKDKSVMNSAFPITLTRDITPTPQNLLLTLIST